jgi:hypothetical protein
MRAKSYFTLVGQPRAKKVVDERRNGPDVEVDHNFGCIKATTSLNKGGYAGLKRATIEQLTASTLAGRGPDRNSGFNFLLHRIAFVAHHGRDLAGNCSHICPNRACFLWSHIVDETQSVNVSRSYCPGRSPVRGTISVSTSRRV